MSKGPSRALLIMNITGTNRASESLELKSNSQKVKKYKMEQCFTISVIFFLHFNGKLKNLNRRKYINKYVIVIDWKRIEKSF